MFNGLVFLSFFSTNDLLLIRFAQRARLGVSWNTLKNHYISLQRIDHHKINDIVMPFIMWSAAHRFTFHNLSRMLFRLKSSLLFCFKRVGKDSKMYESKISCCVLFELKRASIHFSVKYFYTHAQNIHSVTFWNLHHRFIFNSHNTITLTLYLAHGYDKLKIEYIINIQST